MTFSCDKARMPRVVSVQHTWDQTWTHSVIIFTITIICERHQLCCYFPSHCNLRKSFVNLLGCHQLAIITAGSENQSPCKFLSFFQGRACLTILLGSCSPVRFPLTLRKRVRTRRTEGIQGRRPGPPASGDIVHANRDGGVLFGY